MACRSSLRSGVSESLVQRSRHRVPFGSALTLWGDFTENSVWESMACEVKTLVLEGLAPKTFPKRSYGKVFGRTSVRTTKEPRDKRLKGSWGYAQMAPHSSFPDTGPTW